MNSKLSKKLVMAEYKNGLTIKEFKKIIKDLPEINSYNGESFEVWIETGINLSSIVTAITPLNWSGDGKGSDILLSSRAFEED